MEGKTILNLARSWRPQTFAEVVGQPLVVRLLTNGLRRQLLFPVYLLAGLRGSGKTSVARIFAMAVNCGALRSFEQGEWEKPFPCLACSSCRAMMAGEHPDFIEIDAASHTGVDNVRQIIEEASFLPVLGSRKVYLIDEAHMLSKAAFNAFLKILEEPPATVLFLLATTDAQKVIETVRSRSFQLFFDPIPEEALVAHLALVCKKEGVGATEGGLRLICREAGGSVRDALNILERVRLAVDEISESSVAAVLGHLDDRTLVALIEQILNGSLPNLLQWLSQLKGIEAISVDALWERLVEGFRALVWEAAGLSLGTFQPSTQEWLHTLAQRGDINLFVELLDMLYKVESSLQRTTAQRALLERILCLLTQRCSPAVPSERPVATRVAPVSEPRVEKTPEGSPVEEKVTLPSRVEKSADNRWMTFVERYTKQGDALLASVFGQGICEGPQDGIIRVVFPAQFVFYQENLVAQKTVWQPLLDGVFGAGTMMVPEFSGQQKVVKKEVTVRVPVIDQKMQQRTKEPQRRVVPVGEGEEWRRTREVLSVFPGVVTMVEEKHE